MITSFEKTGSYHRSRGQQCQDRTFYLENETHLVMALADGATACPSSRTGARIAGREGAEYVLRYGAALEGFSQEKAAFLLLEQIRSKLAARARADGNPLQDYASTLLICHVNKQQRTATLYALGDDSLFRIRNGSMAAVVSPRRRWSGCPLTLTEDAERAMRITHVRLEAQEKLLLCSDGMAGLFRDPAARETIRRGMMECDFEKVKAAIDGFQNEDDCSFIACGLDHDER